MDHGNCTHSFTHRAVRACEAFHDESALQTEIQKLVNLPRRFVTQLEREYETEEVTVYPAAQFGDIDIYQWSRQGQGETR